MLLYHGQVRKDGRLTDFHILTELDAGKRAGSKKQTAEQKCHPLILAQIIRVIDLLKACAETLPSILRDGQEDTILIRVESGPVLLDPQLNKLQIVADAFGAELVLIDQLCKIHWFFS